LARFSLTKAELAALNVDVIVTYATGIFAAQRATATIPIVAAAAPDLVAMGVVASLAHPGGNVTGSTFFVLELYAKRLELLKEVVRERPDLKLVVADADLVPNAPDAVSTMLAETGLAAAENWMLGDSFVERLRYEVDRRWRGEIPRTMLIGRDGSITTIEGSADIETVRTWLDDQTGREEHLPTR
jgi:hypothetical protein